MNMLNCSCCEGFVPANANRCPHCDIAAPRRRSTLRTLRNIAGGGAVAMTLMACYGGGPARPMPPSEPTNAATCADPNDDIDGDGYCENDCDQMNAAIHPGANDVPGDGIDQDCDGTDAGAAPASDNTIAE